jgi:hypothetical protein
MNNAEKRTVSTDALETLGTLITPAEKRDAIHLAVNPTKAKQNLRPGQDVGIDGTINNPVGIVDPFLKRPVKEGEWFWLVVYPRQINSLRHVWTHPAFPESA